MRDEPKILFWDLETLPDLHETLKVFPRLSSYPGLSMKASHNTVLCFGYRWLTQKKAKCLNAWDFPSWRRSVNDDFALVKFAREQILKADCIVTQNGKAFDWKFLQTRLMFHGLPPLPKILHIDTKLLARKNLFLFNNSLDIMGRFLAGDRKLENGGWDLWCDVYHKKPKAMRLMETYCKQDVNLLVKIFNRLRPFLTDMPNYNIFRRDAVPRCPNCGSFRLQRHGKITRKNKIMQRFLCTDCGTACCDEKKQKYPKVL